jgi:WD40 repeat protein
MSPEQAMAKRIVIDHRTDIYSLGATLCELLTLRPVFEGNDRQELLRQIAFAEPRPLRRTNPAVPRELETIVLKALAKDPSGRYATAQELADDLRRFLEDKPIKARRPTLRDRTAKFVRRHPAGVAAALLVLTVAVIALTISTVLITGARRDALTNLKEASQQRKLATARADELDLQLYFSNIALAHRESRDENPGRAERLLDGCPAHLRDWEWHYLKRQSHTALLTIPAHDDYVFSVTYSPDGKTLATASQDGTARVFDAGTGRLIHTLPGHSPNICWCVTYSPDGKLLASGGRDRTVKVWDTATGELRRTLGGHPDTVWSVAFSPPDGRLFASACVGAVKLWDTNTWREVRTFDGGWEVKFSPDGRLLATAYYDSPTSNRLLVWDVAALEKTTGLVAPRLKHEGHFGYIAFSPDGHSIAAPVWDPKPYDVQILDAESGGTIRSLTGHARAVNAVVYSSGGVNGVAYSPDGRYLASASDDQTVKVWDARTGGLFHTFRGHTDHVRSPVFSPDSRRLATASLDGTVKIWDVTTLAGPAGKETLTLASGPGSVLAVGHSPDGRSVATIVGSGAVGFDVAKPKDPARVEAVIIWDAKTGQKNRSLHNPTAGTCHDVALDLGFVRIAWARENGAVEIRDATTNRLVLTLSGHTALVERVAYSHDGRRLASASRDGTVRVWDAVTGQMIHRLAGFSDQVCCLRFSPDGRRLALAGAKLDQLHPSEVKVWDAATGRSLPTLGGYFEEVGNVAFHPREDRLACSVGSNILIQDVESGRDALRLRGHAYLVVVVAFSPDGRRLVSAWADGSVRLWETATGREILTLLHGGGGEVAGLSFSPDGHQIVAVSQRGTIKVWDATPLTPEVPPGANVAPE